MAKMFVAFSTSLKVVKYKALFYNAHKYKIVVKLMKYSIMNASSKALTEGASTCSNKHSNFKIHF